MKRGYAEPQSPTAEGCRELDQFEGSIQPVGRLGNFIGTPKGTGMSVWQQRKLDNQMQTNETRAVRQSTYRPEVEFTTPHPDTLEEEPAESEDAQRRGEED